MNVVSDSIKKLRKEKGMTQDELAEKLNVTRQAVSNWERGNTMPDISKLPELAEIFHISVDELLNGKAPLVAAVLNDTVDEYMEEGNVTEQEIADALPLLKPEQAVDILEKAEDFDLAVHDLIKKYMTEHQRIIFNGNGYADEWVEEAKRRGLPNIKTMVEATETLTTPKAVALFEKFGIFTKAELESRVEILYETYAKTINIEALTMIDMASKQIIPAVVKYTKSLADTVNAVREAGADASAQIEILNDTSKHLSAMKAALKKLEEVDRTAATMEPGKEQAFYYREVVTKAMDDLRAPADALEMIVDKEIWPFPTYGDLLFEV